MSVITTNRLILRPITADDLEDIYEYAKNENVGPRAGWKPHENREETEQIIKDVFLDQETVWGIVRKEDQKLIGTMGLIADPKRQHDGVRMLGYGIGEPYWGRGITTEAAKAVVQYGFTTMNLSLISAYCYPFNKESRRVIEKCGLKYEATFRHAEKRYDGIVLDNLCFSLSKEEYEQEQKV